MNNGIKDAFGRSFEFIYRHLQMNKNLSLLYNPISIPLLMKLLPAFLLFASILLSSSSFAQAGKKTSILVRFTEPVSYTKIYLDTLAARGAAEFTSADAGSDGSFELNFVLRDENLYKLRLDQANFMWLILTPGEKVSVIPNGKKLGPDATVNGSHHTALLYSALLKSRTFDLKRDSLNKEYNNIQSSPKHDSLSTVIIRNFTENDSLQKATLAEAIKKEPASLAWMFFTDKFDISGDFPFVDNLDRELIKAYPDNTYVRQYHDQVEMERKTGIGKPAPDISLPGVDGNNLSLSSLKGKVVLLDFWASWCGPCRKENPNVVNIYNRYHDKGFDVFSVSLDKDKASWLKGISADNLSWPNHVSDLKYWKSEGAAAYGVTSIPYSVLIDRNGIIVAKKLRGQDLEKKVAELLR